MMSARLDMADEAWHGVARLGLVRSDLAVAVCKVGRGVVRQGMSWRLGLGLAWCGSAWSGGKGLARNGESRRGTARRGLSVKARYVMAWSVMGVRKVIAHD